MTKDVHHIYIVRRADVFTDYYCENSEIIKTGLTYDQALKLAQELESDESNFSWYYYIEEDDSELTTS